MSVLADRIEKFILQKLLEDQEPIVILQRNELADELACAPSQISYVLSTRFSNERGFIVESRRGLGGFIRIQRIEEAPAEVEMQLTSPMKKAIGQKKQEQPVLGGDTERAQSLGSQRQVVPTTLGRIDNMLLALLQEGHLTKREAALMHEAYALLLTELTPSRRGIGIGKLYQAMCRVLEEE